MNILITGTQRGLGKIISRHLSGGGNVIIGIDKDEMNSNSFVSDYHRLDLNDLDKIEEVFMNIKNKHEKIDVLINNAGIKYFEKLSNISLKDVKKVYNVNILSLIILTKYVLELMKAKNYGRIINISSNAAFQGYAGGCLYNSTKSAINLFTESLKNEIVNFNNITVNSICPETMVLYELGSESIEYENNKFVNPSRILRLINKLIINPEINGQIIPVISYKTKLKYLIKDISKNLCWLSKNY